MTKVIMIQSFRGGTGKSTIISNIAYSLAKRGRKVVIIDADVESPGIHAQFGFNAKSFEITFTDYLLDGAKIKQAIYDISHILDFPDNRLLLVPSALSLTHITHTLNSPKSYGKIRTAIKEIQKLENPDYILVDTHPGINEEMLLTLENADLVLNIVRPDNQDYQGARLSTTISKRLKTKHYIILNKVHSKVELKKTIDKIEKLFDVPVVQTFPFTEDILFAEGKYIFSDKHPKHIFSKKIDKLVTEVV